MEPLLGAALLGQSSDLLAKRDKKKAKAKARKQNKKQRRNDKRNKNKKKDKTKQRRRARSEAAPGCCSTGNCTPGTGKNLTRCCFEHQNLTGKSFKGSNLTEVNFTGANLTNAKFQQTNLTRACLVDADITGANFKGANLSGVIRCRTKDGSNEDNSGCDRGTPCCPTCERDADCEDGQGCCNGRCQDRGWDNLTTFGTAGNGNDQFVGPLRLALSADELTILVADRSNNRIGFWTRPNTGSLNWSSQTPFGAGQLNDPTDVAISGNGLTAIVADSNNNRISVWTRLTATSLNWSNQTTFGSQGNGDNQFNGASGVAISADGLTAWVADQDNDRISVWTRSTATGIDWSPHSTFGSEGNGDNQFRSPVDVTVSADGLAVWVADAGNNRISVWTRSTASSIDWSPQSTFGSGPGNAANQFTFPAGVAVSGDGLTAWIGDASNNRVSVWTRPTATSTNWSPLATFGSQGNGDDQFSRPEGVVVSANELTVWVADLLNNRISIWGFGCPDA